MKAVTVAAAAAFLGSVNADGWEGWNSTTVATPEATTTSSDAESTWTAWTTSTPVMETTTTSSDPSWSEWSTTSSKPADSTKTTTKSGESSWSEWSTTSSKPSVNTKTTSSDGENSWSEWSSTTSSKPSEATETSTWEEWTPTGTTTITSTSTQWLTVTVYPADDGKSWSQWATSTGASSMTPDASSTPVVYSTVTSWGAWATPSVDADGCKLQVGVSYGAPVWYPTPALATAANTTWGEWQSSTSSKPVAATSSSSGAWSEWATSSTTSKPVMATSSSSDGWSEWAASSTSSKPVVATSSSSASWSAWSQSEAANFYTKSSASASASATGSAGSSTNSVGITVKGDKFGMTYSPYTASSGCKDQATVNSDIAKLAGLGFSSVRVYSTDCSTLEFVGAAAKQYGIKIILGVFISNTGISGAQPQVDAIAKWAQWDLVELIVVGNEAVFNNYCSASDLAGLISSSKATFKAAGYTGAVSTTDDLSIWQGQGAAWCDVVDVVTANLYAFFNPNTKAEDAGTFIQSEINDLSMVCPGKEVYVMESGWPSAGQCNGVACPSPENQATAINAIQKAVGAKIVYFSFEDEAWKAPGQYGVEQHWGAADVFASGSWGKW